MDPLAGRWCEGTLSRFPRTIARIWAKPLMERFSFLVRSLILDFYTLLNTLLINLHISLSVCFVTVYVYIILVHYLQFRKKTHFLI